MNRSLTLLPLFALLLAAPAAYAQCAADCRSDAYFCGLRTGQTLAAPCDSMVVLNRPTYERLMTEAAQQERLARLSRQAEDRLGDMLATQDSLLGAQQRYLAALERNDRVLQDLNHQLTARLDTSIHNTERAIAIARRNRTLGVLLGGALGTAVGIVVGVLL